MHGVTSPLLAVALNVPASHTLWIAEGGALVFIAVVVAILLARRAAHRRDLRQRRAGAGAYFDADVAHMGLGPAGFQGVRAASQATSKPLAPSFGPPGVPGQSGAGFATASPDQGAGPAAGATPPGQPAAYQGVVIAHPAGWYPDPHGDPTLLRYWDGNGWTAHVETRP